MRRGVAKQYAMVPETWALEYARGESISISEGTKLMTRMDPVDAAYGIRRYVHFNT